MNIMQSKTSRELEAVREIERNLEQREKRQRVMRYITAGAALVAVVACLTKIFKKD